ncbi:MAG: sigma-70 family RNA polymerase sigma factor [Ktedonobacteraceae bacterium]|nr:sigma-70 family RNA polymerase sigma factor [Ktedonobacteraceae bacterium]
MSKSVRDDEELLIVRSQRGEVDAFNQLVLRYQQTVYSAVFRLLGNYDVASDVTQNTFIAAYRSIQSYRGSSSFRSWLLRIGSNMACDHWRSVHRHPVESLEELTEEDEAHSSSLLSILATKEVESNPEAMLLSQEFQGVIQQGLQQLPLDQRVAVVLCDIQRLSYEEIATTTQATLGTVRSRIARGRGRLRTYLRQHQELLPHKYRLNTDSSL